MITRIQVLNYRSLRYVDESLARFQVLVGANGSGKTTFLDTISFVGDILQKGVNEAVFTRARSFHDLVWNHEERPIDIALEASLRVSEGNANGSGPSTLKARYELRVEYSRESNRIEITHERLVLLTAQFPDIEEETRELFPGRILPPENIFLPRASGRSQTFKSVITKTRDGNDNYYPEVAPKSRSKKKWSFSYRLGPLKSALSQVPADEEKFPVSLAFREFLTKSVQTIVLNSLLMRRASPPGQGRLFCTDGSNLPWVVEHLRDTAPQQFEDWIAHLKTAIADLSTIRVTELLDDRHKHLSIEFRSGVLVPSWMASDGTLRLLALTLPAYLPDFGGAYLIEEPENGIHPRAIEALCQSLSSVYRAQILMATHSPVILSMVEPNEVLCFAKTTDGQTDIVRGDHHPALRGWKDSGQLGTLLVAGVLG